MKPVKDWDWKDIQTLPIGEFDWLEAKGLGGPPGQPPKIDENKVREMLAKVISALANSGGGQFIWGVKDPDEAEGWVVENGGIPARHGKRATGDWLEDIIPNLMDAPLKGFNVYTVREAENLAEDHVLFVIDVKDSSLAPHQNTWDNKYYGRVGGKSKPLNHRFVMDIMGRRQNPKFELEFWISPEKMVGQVPMPGQTLHIKARNIGRVYAQYVTAIFTLPWVVLDNDVLRHHQDEITETTSKVSTLRENRELELKYHDSKAGMFGHSVYGDGPFQPILPQLSYRWTIELNESWQEIATQNGIEQPSLDWEIFADNAAPEQGSILLSQVPVDS